MQRSPLPQVSHRRRVVDTGAAAVVDTVVVWAAVTVWVVVRYQLEADDAADRRDGTINAIC